METDEAMSVEYVIKKAAAKPELKGLWDGPVWQTANLLEAGNFHPASSGHRPVTRAKVLYDDTSVYVIFRVEDRYVRCTRTDYQAMVCRDACVEFFVQPQPGNGYFNFEVNAIGTLHLSYIEDARRTPDGFEKFTPVPWSLGRTVQIYHSLNGRIFPEIEEAMVWVVEYAIPLTVLEAYVEGIGNPAGQTWRANFYKCADECSHPHWASWAPVGEKLDFHQPDKFAPLCFR